MKYLILIAMFIDISYMTVLRDLMTNKRLVEETPAGDISPIEYRTKNSFVPVPHLSCDEPDNEKRDIASCLYNQQRVWIRAI